jgi:tetratricopeptide (TPR) repeat protein
MGWRKLSRVSPGRFQGRDLWISLGLLAIIASGSGNSLALPLSDQVREADDYYLGRQNPENVAEALKLLRADVAQNPEDYEAWWRISKFIYYDARHAAGSNKMKLLDEGADAAKKAIALNPNRVEGHFWLGANYDLISEARGYLRGLLFVDAIRKEMEIVKRLDPDYEQAGGLRALGRLDYRAPFFLGGDKRLSIQLFKECLDRFPENSTGMLFLSDSYVALGLRDEARQQLEQVLNLCPDPEYASELAENQEEARTRLAKLDHSTK